MVELQENGNKACDPGTQRLHSPLRSSHRARLKGQDMEEGPEPRGPRQGDLTPPWGDPRTPDEALLHSSTSWGLAYGPVCARLSSPERTPGWRQTPQECADTTVYPGAGQPGSSGTFLWAFSSGLMTCWHTEHVGIM